LSKHTVGCVYVLSNKAMPGMVKVGMTTDLAEGRAERLRSPDVPFPFDVEFRALTSHPHEVEKRAHEYLETFRVAPDQEFFEVSPDMAVETLREVLLEVAGIDAWDADEPYHVRSGDRIALTVSAGDLFVVLALPGPTAGRAEPIDIWQAHGDGDLLELTGTRDAAAAAGSGDDDPGVVDPALGLDRDRRMPDGVVNGRERLVPGDRLLWLTPLAGGQICRIALFEMRDHCRVVSRTWDGKPGPDGRLLLLTTPTYEELPPGVTRTIQLVMRMAPPRSWAPRS
jgi:hypothetical protein